MRKLFGLIFLLLAALSAWSAWGPVRGWMFAQIPSDVAWAGIAKIAIVVLVAWGGGIAAPLMLVVISGYILFSDNIR